MNDEMQNLLDLFALAQQQGIDVFALLSLAMVASSGAAPAQREPAAPEELPTLFYPH